MNKALLIGFKNSINRLGSDGAMFTDYKAPWRLERLAADFARAGNHDAVYIVRRPLYDPLYNEMNTLDYVKKYGRIIYQNTGGGF